MGRKATSWSWMFLHHLPCTWWQRGSGQKWSCRCCLIVSPHCRSYCAGLLLRRTPAPSGGGSASPPPHTDGSRWGAGGTPCCWSPWRADAGPECLTWSYPESSGQLCLWGEQMETLHNSLAVSMKSVSNNPTAKDKTTLDLHMSESENREKTNLVVHQL